MHRQDPQRYHQSCHRALSRLPLHNRACLRQPAELGRQPSLGHPQPLGRLPGAPRSGARAQSELRSVACVLLSSPGSPTQPRRNRCKRQPRRWTAEPWSPAPRQPPQLAAPSRKLCGNTMAGAEAGANQVQEGSWMVLPRTLVPVPADQAVATRRSKRRPRNSSLTQSRKWSPCSPCSFSAAVCSVEPTKHKMLSHPCSNRVCLPSCERSFPYCVVRALTGTLFSVLTFTGCCCTRGCDRGTRSTGPFCVPMCELRGAN